MGLVAKQMSTGDRTILGRISKRGNGRTARALHIWRDARLGAGTIVARYLESRGIAFDRWPPSLRFHSRSPRPRDDEGGLLPPLQAMVAEHVERGPVAVHCTHSTPDGSAKARLPERETWRSLLLFTTSGICGTGNQGGGCTSASTDRGC